MNESTSRREFLRQTGICASALSGLTFLSSQTSAMENEPFSVSNRKRPNIIFLMDDQHRWDCLGKVNPLLKTPHLDALIDNGILFDQAVCQVPMCIPSRYSLMLGLYPSQIGIRMNRPGLRDEELPSVPLPEQLRQAGYQTAGFGKTHWARKGCSTRGFENRAIGQNRDGELYEEGATMMTDDNPDGYKRYMNETKPFGPGEEEVLGFVGMTSQIPEEDHRDGWVLGQCLKFLDEGLDTSRPLFLYLSFLKPHAGMNIPGGFEELYDLREIPDVQQPPWTEEIPGHAHRDNQSTFQKERHQRYINFWSQSTVEQRKKMVLRYWANCSWIDDMFGRAIAKMREKSILDNALIVFVSDHGEMLGDRFYRFTKYCLYEGSVRVPLILSGTAVPIAKQGTTDDRYAELVDIFPTLLKTAGLEPNPRFPGYSLLQSCPRMGAFCEYQEGRGKDQKAPAYMWRKKDWKLILYMPGKLHDAHFRIDQVKGEMYNLKEDPKEWNNLFKESKFAAIREQMTRELLMHLAVVNTNWPMAIDGKRE